MAYKYNGIDITTLMEPRGSFATMSPDFDKYLVNGNASLYQQYAGLLYLTNPLAGTYKRDGIAIEPASRGTMPVATNFYTITSPGTYSITRSDSFLTIGSTTFYPSNFPRINAIPKIIGIMACGGGGGGGGAGGTFLGAGCGGGGGGYAIGVVNLKSSGAFIVVVGGGGGAGAPGGYDGNPSGGGAGGDTYISINGDKLGGQGGHGGAAAWGGSSSAGGLGGWATGSAASDFSNFTRHYITGERGASGGHQCQSGYGATAIGGYLSERVSAAYLSTSGGSGGATHGSSGYGYGGGGGASIGNGGEGGGSFGDGGNGSLGGGGGSGSAGITYGNDSGSGGNGAIWFYY